MSFFVYTTKSRAVNRKCKHGVCYDTFQWRCHLYDDEIYIQFRNTIKMSEFNITKLVTSSLFNCLFYVMTIYVRSSFRGLRNMFANTEHKHTYADVRINKTTNVG